MTTTTNPSTESEHEDFTTSEGLRALLNRLHAGGEDTWVHDPVAPDLVEFTLALIHNLSCRLAILSSTRWCPYT